MPTDDRRAPIRVLVAEDDELVRSLIERLLEMQGWQVVAVANGEDAVKAWRAAGGFDLGILDVRMPKMNGYDAYLAIRRLSPSARFLFVSGYADEEIETRLTRDERQPFMAKPFDSDALLERVYTLLGDQGHRPLYAAYD
jgi:two-component system cell cycle sensor histidine kinase/response regulator CckA